MRPVFEFQFSGRTKTKQAKYAFAMGEECEEFSHGRIVRNFRMGEECEEFSVGGASAR